MVMQRVGIRIGRLDDRGDLVRLAETALNEADSRNPLGLVVLRLNHWAIRLDFRFMIVFYRNRIVQWFKGP